MERTPHLRYNIISNFFKIDSLKNRYLTLNLRFLFKLLHNMIDCTELLEVLNIKVPTLDKLLFYFIVIVILILLTKLHNITYRLLSYCYWNLLFRK